MMGIRSKTGYILWFVVLGLAPLPVYAEKEKSIFGWIEKVIIAAEQPVELDAKLDTGADTSSLDAHVVKRFKRGGKRFVRFTVADPATKEMITLVRPYLRRVRIKQHDGKHQQRVVVSLPICIGGKRQDIDVTLIDRQQFDYPLLLGRSALEGIAVIDPEIKLTQNPNCPVNEEDIVDRSVGKTKKGSKDSASQLTANPVHERQQPLSTDNEQQ